MTCACAFDLVSLLQVRARAITRVLGLWMLNRSRRPQGKYAKLTFLAVPALVLALVAVGALPVEARHHRGLAMPAGLTDPEKDAALIVDGETGKVLYARNADDARHPASLTKMMTLYLLFDALKRGQVTLATSLPISAHAAAQKPTNLHLSSGDSLSVEVAIKAIVVRSANDVAVAIAEAGRDGEVRYFGEGTRARHAQHLLP